MAITSSAKKALRSSERKAEYNTLRRDTMKLAIKSVKKLVAENRIKEARELVSKAQQAIDKAAKTNLIKANAAARKKSRLVAFVKKAEMAGK